VAGKERAMADDDLLTARTRFISFHEGNGRPVVVEHRSIARKGHPVVEAQPDLWEPLTVHFEVEQPKSKATGAGGTKK
jgi:hypothetical protein